MAIAFNWPNPAGPIGKEQVLSAPTVASKGRGQLDVFVVGPDHQIWTKWWSYDTYKWSDWGFLGGAWHNSAPAVASKAPGELDLFIVGDDHRVYTKWFNFQQGWSPNWAPVGNGFYASPGIARNAAGEAMVLALDSHFNVAFKAVSPGLPGAVWSYLQDGFVVVDAPAALPQQIVATRNDHQVYVKSVTGSPWDLNQHYQWVSIGGSLVSQPGTFSDGPGNIFVFGQEGDGTLWSNIFDSSVRPHGGWQGWVPLGDALTSAPAAVSKDLNQVDVFFKGPDGALWNKSGVIQ